MSNNIDLHGIVMQQAETISKLTAQLAAFVLNPELEPKQVRTYDPNLKGSDLVREHFRRSGGEILCFIDDDSDEEAIAGGTTRHVKGVDDDRQSTSYPFITRGLGWKYAVACTPNGRVLTASELLG